jgi:hypothetical protein
LQSGNSAVRLHGTVPTWSSSSDICMFPLLFNFMPLIQKSGLDLHDLHELRSRFLLFIHDLLQSLRSSGVRPSRSKNLFEMYLPCRQVVASYSLAPSSSSLCLVCALPPGLGTSQVTASVVEMLKSTEFGKRSGVWPPTRFISSDMPQRQCLTCTSRIRTLFDHHLNVFDTVCSCHHLT